MSADKQLLPSKPMSISETTITLVANATDLLSLFECCVCFEPIPPPILQCSNGHLFCRTCRNHFSNPAKCPNCLVHIYEDIRCAAIERLAVVSRLHFTCKYMCYGCPMATTLRLKRAHEDCCPYRPYSCSEFYSDRLNWLCRWSGTADQLVAHMRVDHQLPICDLTDKLNIVCNYRPDLRDCLWESLIVFEEQVFLFRLAKRTDLFNAVLLFIGEQVSADHFWYSLEIEMDLKGTKLRCEAKPVSIRHNSQSLVFNADGLHFSTKLAQNCLQLNYFDIVVRIARLSVR